MRRRVSFLRPLRPFVSCVLSLIPLAPFYLSGGIYLGRGCLRASSASSSGAPGCPTATARSLNAASSPGRRSISRSRWPASTLRRRTGASSRDRSCRGAYASGLQPSARAMCLHCGGWVGRASRPWRAALHTQPRSMSVVPLATPSVWCLWSPPPASFKTTRACSVSLAHRRCLAPAALVCSWSVRPPRALTVKLSNSRAGTRERRQCRCRAGRVAGRAAPEGPRAARLAGVARAVARRAR